MKVPYNYLDKQFDPTSVLCRRIWSDMRDVVQAGDFTLGAAVGRFEAAFAKVCGTKHAVGVSSGTAALTLAMKAHGVGPGDEVVTVPNTFVATVGAILAVGAKPVLVDVGDDYLMDLRAASKAVTDRTKLVIPVDLTGNPVRCGRALQGTHKGVYVLRDSCQAVGAMIGGEIAASKALASAFSLHPLKNVNVWGDGGVVVTDNDGLAEAVRLLRNHGLRGRDTVVVPGVNERLATMQAVVGLRVLETLPEITRARFQNARWYDEALRGLPGVVVPQRPDGVLQVFHTYVICVNQREELRAWLTEREVETKIHYPVPLHLQPGFKALGYHEGDFPIAESQARHILSLPIHQYLTEAQIGFVADSVRRFYKRGG